jgi:hypothetical protein
MPLDQPLFPASGRTMVRGACPHDCPDTCALHVTVENGRAVKVEGDPGHPTTNGVLCTKVARYLERTYSLLDRTICATAGKAGYAATIGASIGIDMEEFENARLILIWGLEPDRIQSASVEPDPGSQTPGRQADRDRSLPQPDCGEMSPPSRVASRDRRRAGIGRDACPDWREFDRL